MAKHTFSVQPRTLSGRKVKQLRAQGLVPANLFGKNVDSLTIQLNAKDFMKFRQQVGESSLLYLQVSGEKSERPVLMRDLLLHPVNGQILHVTFQQVDLKEKTTATVPVVLHGEAPAETEKKGIMIQQLSELEVEALPADIPENFTVDVSSLTEVGSAIQAKDLRLDPQKFTLVTDADTVIVQISPLAAEEAAPEPAVPAEGEPAAPDSAEAQPAPESASPAEK